MHRVVGCVVLALVAAGCHAAALPVPPPPGLQAPEIHESPSPFRSVTVGDVRTVIPDEWRPIQAFDQDDPREGIVARPRPGAWEDGRIREGMAALWVDGAKVGVPSDYYYLAATSHALDLVTRSRDCRVISETVIVNHLPSYVAGDADSPGDYIARGHGTCEVDRVPTRWAYFVAAPGYGPARQVGIPSSGLYVVVAVMPDGPRTPAVLNKVLLRTEFAGATIQDFIAAARLA
ncbi:MAG TPA: hypothetical protein VLE71_03525 [Actinomycetota bacterium]|nr:hypothetical protein [Actinomycetota bacterium]